MVFESLYGEIYSLRSEAVRNQVAKENLSAALGAEHELRLLYQNMVKEVQTICDDERYDDNLDEALALIEFIIAPSELGGYHA